MANELTGKVGILWRGDRDRAGQPLPDNHRLKPVFDALTALDIEPQAVIYSDDAASEVRDQLLGMSGVLVWVDPITGEDDRSVLDAMLREVASRGRWVSAHPDVILEMGTKEVIFRTRELGWGADTRLYDSFAAFQERFPTCVGSSGPRVLKQNRGNGGIGVWKVEMTGASNPERVTPDAIVRVQHAQKRDDVTEDLPLGAFMERCRHYFDGTGLLVDQAFQQRITEGMIRCYMIQDAVVGFAHQSPAPSAELVLGLPAAKTMFPESEPRFQALRRSMESEWVPEKQRLLGIDRSALPLLWDADFLYGAKTAAGEDTYVLCEINVSCVSPFPDTVPSRLAQAVRARLASRADAG
jgi:hypothetical protein